MGFFGAQKAQYCTLKWRILQDEMHHFEMWRGYGSFSNALF